MAALIGRLTSTRLCVLGTAVVAVLSFAAAAAAQSEPRQGSSTAPPVLPANYVIGIDDVLSVSFYREEAMSAEVTVRPDGKISLPLLKDVHAAGLSPAQLGDALEGAAKRFLTEPNVTVAVKQVNSRRVYLLGEGIKPGSLQLNGDMNVLQAVAMAGGILEWAKEDRIEIHRTENGVVTRHRFNYKQVIKGEKPEQNILLKPGDVIVVP